MAKLYELISPEKGAKFNIEYKGTVKELTLGRFDLIHIVELESKGLSLEKFMSKAEEVPAKFALELGFSLLEEKEEFNQEYKVFVKIMGSSSENITNLFNAITEAIDNSEPIKNKKEETKNE